MSIKRKIEGMLLAMAVFIVMLSLATPPVFADGPDDKEPPASVTPQVVTVVGKQEVTVGKREPGKDGKSLSGSSNVYVGGILVSMYSQLQGLDYGWWEKVRGKSWGDATGMLDWFELNAGLWREMTLTESGSDFCDDCDQVNWGWSNYHNGFNNEWVQDGYFILDEGDDHWEGCVDAKHQF